MWAIFLVIKPNNGNAWNSVKFEIVPIQGSEVNEKIELTKGGYQAFKKGSRKKWATVLIL